jgi:hypothetical protein
MEKRLPQTLHADIRDADGRWAQVALVAYLGDDRWYARRLDGGDIIVEANQILSVALDRPV